MKYAELTEYLVKALVKESDLVSVKEMVNEENNIVTIEVLVPKSDMGIVIGRKGNIINSIRTIVQAASSINTNQKIVINVDSF